MVHIVPGVSYMLISLIYFPLFTKYISYQFGFIISLSVKLILAFVLLWGTLAVGDLVELIESLILYP